MSINKNCKEIKRSLSGNETIYNCKLIFLCNNFGILKYVFERERQIGSLSLHPGMVSYGLYWRNRPYNLYSWFDRNKNPIAYYFNLADSLNLSPEKFLWRDLIVDILVLPRGAVEVLDEKDLPSSLDKNTKDYIQSAKELVLENYKAIIRETNVLLNKYVR